MGRNPFLRGRSLRIARRRTATRLAFPNVPLVPGLTWKTSLDAVDDVHVARRGVVRHVFGVAQRHRAHRRTNVVGGPVPSAPPCTNVTALALSSETSSVLSVSREGRGGFGRARSGNVVPVTVPARCRFRGWRPGIPRPFTLGNPTTSRSFAVSMLRVGRGRRHDVAMVYRRSAPACASGERRRDGNTAGTLEISRRQ